MSRRALFCFSKNADEDTSDQFNLVAFDLDSYRALNGFDGDYEAAFASL